MPLTFRWKGSTTLPVEGESLRPETFAGLSAVSVARRSLRVGNTEVELGDLFDVSGDASDGSIHLEGDLRHVRRIGRGMTFGSILIQGDCGTGLGQGMLGGEISVEGSVGDSVGMGMRGGLLRIRGSAGDNLGGSEPGARLGMREGVILVVGNVGHDAGLAMRRGLIAVSGDCGNGLGRGMIAGSIFAFGHVGQGIGRGMKRGSIVLFGGAHPRLGPGFSPSGRDLPTFVAIYLKKLKALEFPIPGRLQSRGGKEDSTNTLSPPGERVAAPPPGEGERTGAERSASEDAATDRDRPVARTPHPAAVPPPSPSRGEGVHVPGAGAREALPPPNENADPIMDSVQDGAFVVQLSRYNGDRGEHGQGEILVAGYVQSRRSRSS